MREWTKHDTEICERAEASGIAINLKTNKPITMDELHLLSLEYDKIRNIISLDMFLKDKIKAEHWNFDTNKPLNEKVIFDFH